MKQTFLWLFMGLCALTFVACGSDDDNKSNGGNVPTGKVTLAQAVGTWQMAGEVSWKVNSAGETYDYKENTNAEPDWVVIKADGTFEYWEYDNGERHLDAAGPLDIENGYVVGNGMVKFTGVTIQGNVMVIATVDYNHDGKGYDKYEVLSLIKVN